MWWLTRYLLFDPNLALICDATVKLRTSPSGVFQGLSNGPTLEGIGPAVEEISPTLVSIDRFRGGTKYCLTSETVPYLICVSDMDGLSLTCLS